LSGCNPKAALMCFDDRRTNRQPHADPSSFVLKKASKGLFRILKAGSVIPHLGDGGMRILVC